MKLLKNCMLVPELTEGYVGDPAGPGHDGLIKGDLLIDQKIVAVGAPGSLDSQAGENAEIIDLTGCTLLPAFFDLHCHLYLENLDIAGLDSNDESTDFVNAYHFAKAYLRQGFTTLRDAGTAHDVTIKLTRLYEKGKIDLIPDILSSGRALTPTNAGNDQYTHLYEVCDGPDEARRAARRQFEHGAQVIKYMATGCFLDDSGIPGMSITTEEEMHAAVEIADMHFGHVMTHAHGADGIKRAIRAGVRTIEHGSFIDDEAIDMLLEAGDRTWMVPTGGIGIACMTDEGETLLTDAMSQKSAMYEKIERDSVDHAYQRGLKMGFGSDVDYQTFINMPGIEFRARTDWYHFKPLDILIQATRNSAEIIGMQETKGTIKVGKNAELVAVKGDPLSDITVMYELPEYVFFKGETIR